MYQGSAEHTANMKAAWEKSFANRGKRKQDRVDAYLRAPKHCAECQAVLPYEKQHNKFCSCACSVTLSNKRRAASGAYHSATAKEKIAAATRAAWRATLIHGSGLPVCAHCKTEFEPRRRSREKYCSVACSKSADAAHRATEAYRRKASEQGKVNIAAQMAAGKWSGWTVRNGPSYAEAHVHEELKARGFSFETEYRVGRFSIDIAFASKKIAVEVDGKQHETEQQRKHDANRDQHLVEHGWTVFRLKWYSIKSSTGRQRVQDQLDELVRMLNAS